MSSIPNDFISKINENRTVFGVLNHSKDEKIMNIISDSGFDFVTLDHSDFNIINYEVCKIKQVFMIDINNDRGIDDLLNKNIHYFHLYNANNIQDTIKVLNKIENINSSYFSRDCDFFNYKYPNLKVKEDNFVVLQLTGYDSFNKIEEYLKIEGYNVLFIDSLEFSNYLGLENKVNNPRFYLELSNIYEMAKKYNKIIGTFAKDFDTIKSLKSININYILYSTDYCIIQKSFEKTFNDITNIGEQRSIASVLDCTLRDGGYVNSWNFGQKNIKRIIDNLCLSGIEYIECGFLTNKDIHITGSTKFNHIDEINKLLPKKQNKNFALMINYGQYAIDDIPIYQGFGINAIRVAFHKKDLENALDFCRKIKEKGYLVFVQAMVSLNYTDSEYMYMIRKCNLFNPYALYVVDSFGVMKKEEVLHYFNMLEKELNKNIYLGFHAHNNMQLAFSNAMILLEKASRPFIIDCSIHGMGRGAGNLNTELLIEYLNDNYLGKYDLKPILESNDLVLEKIYSSKPWGYSLPNYLSAKYNCHPNYASFLNEKNNLTLDDLNAIFGTLDEEKKVDFDKKYIEELYFSYLESKDSKQDDFMRVKSVLEGKNIIMVCPGKSSLEKHGDLKKYMYSDSVIISVNFEYDLENVNYIFVGNNKRMNELDSKCYHKVIATSNIPNNNVFAKINYSSLLNGDETVSDNTGLMLLKLLNMVNINSLVIIGMDGYSYKIDDNYINSDLIITTKRETIDNLNLGIKRQFSLLTEKINLTVIK